MDFLSTKINVLGFRPLSEVDLLPYFNDMHYWIMLIEINSSLLLSPTNTSRKWGFIKEIDDYAVTGSMHHPDESDANIGSISQDFSLAVLDTGTASLNGADPARNLFRSRTVHFLHDFLSPAVCALAWMWSTLKGASPLRRNVKATSLRNRLS